MYAIQGDIVLTRSSFDYAFQDDTVLTRSIYLTMLFRVILYLLVV